MIWKNLEREFDVDYATDSLPCGYRNKPGKTIQDFMPKLPVKARLKCLAAADQVQFVVEELSHLIDRYLSLRLFIFCEEYNKVLRCFNFDERVFNFSSDRIRALSTEPPELISTLCDEVYPNVFATAQEFPNSDFGGANLDNLFEIRSYLQTCDPMHLEFIADPENAQKIWNRLLSEKKVKHCGLWFIPKQGFKRSRVQEPVSWESVSGITQWDFTLLWNVESGTFQQFEVCPHRILRKDGRKFTRQPPGCQIDEED